MNKFCDYLLVREINTIIKLEILNTFENVKNNRKSTRINELLGHLIRLIKFENNQTLKLDKFRNYEELLYFIRIVEVFLKYD